MAKSNSAEKNTWTLHEPLAVHHLSHDLRGPLNSILGFSELLLEGIEGPLNDTQTEDIAAIYHSAQNLLHLINSLVDLSKLQGNRLKFDFDAVDLATVFQRIAAVEFGAMKPANLDLVIEAPPATLPSLSGDAARIEQMILNLLRYAFKIKRSGQLKLTARHLEPDVVIQISLPEVLVPVEDMAVLFDLGVRVDAAGRSELGPGGLELPLVRSLAAHQGGQVRVESGVKSGTHLYLTLPVYDIAVEKGI